MDANEVKRTEEDYLCEMAHPNCYYEPKKKQWECLDFGFEHTRFKVMKRKQYGCNINFIAHFNSALLTCSR